MFNKKEIELLKEEIEKLKKENDKIKESYGLSKSKELKEEIEKLNEQINFLEKDNRDYRIKNTELQNKLSIVEKDKSTIENDLTYYKNRYDNLVKLKAGQDDELAHVYEEKQQLIENIEELNKNISVKDIEIGVYKQAISNVTLTFQKSEKQIQPKTKKEIK